MTADELAGSSATDTATGENGAIRPPPFEMAGVCDTHIHQFGPLDRYPYVEDRRYTPPEATIADYREIMAKIGIERAVLSQPSVHGMDHGSLLNGLAQGDGAFRGVVMVNEDVGDATLQEMHTAGVRAIRTQLQGSWLQPNHAKPLDVDALRKVAARVASLGWHVEVHVNVTAVPDIDLALADFPTPVLIEHMGHVPPEAGVDHPGFQALLRLIRDGGWVMFSGPYLHSTLPPPHDDIRPYFEALLEVGAERAVYGSNWPHPHQDPVPDDWFWADAVKRWIGDDRILQQVLVENPAKLYDYPAISQSTKKG